MRERFVDMEEDKILVSLTKIRDLHQELVTTNQSTYQRAVGLSQDDTRAISQDELDRLYIALLTSKIGLENSQIDVLTHQHKVEE